MSRVAPRLPRPGSRIGLVAQTLTIANEGAESAIVEVCVESTCTTPVRSFVTTSTRIDVEPPLPVGRYVWRARTAGSTAAMWPVIVTEGPTRRGTTQVDIDADGYADVVVGAPEMAAAYVFRGGCGGPAVPHAERLRGGGYGFGSGLDAAGDVNGDGALDLLAGGRGPTFVVGGRACSSSEGLVTIEGPTPDQAVGLVGIGDADGDGYDDFATSTSPIGAGDIEYVCEVLVHYGDAERIGARSLWLRVEDSDSWCTTPWPISAADADLTGDGLPDVVVGRLDLDAVHIYEASADATGLPVRRIAGEPGTQFGWATSAADLDCDAEIDLAVAQLEPMRLELIRANGDPLRIDLPAPSVTRGIRLAALGDLDGDGCDDLAISTFDDVLVAFGGADGPSLVTIEPPEERYLLYFTVAGPGDVDGDGFPDLAVGSVDLEAGLVTVYAGGTRGFPEIGRLAIEPFHSIHGVGSMFGQAIAGH